MKEKIKNSFHRVKTHLYDNKETYITGVVCLAIGTSIGYALGNSDDIKNAPKAMVVGKNNMVDQSTIINVVRNGHPGKALLDPLSNIQYPSINAASKSLGVSPNAIRSLIESGNLIHLGDANPT